MMNKPPERWIELDNIKLWDQNPNEGDIGAIIVSIREYGYQNAVCLWKNNIVKSGNHSTQALRMLRKEGKWTPFGDAIYVDGFGVWHVRYLDISHLNEAQSNAFGIAANRTTRLGHDDISVLTELLQEIAEFDEDAFIATGYTEGDLEAMLAILEGDQADIPEKIEPAKPSPRKLPIDMIYTLQGADVTCCIAVQAGFKYGIQSAAFRICPYEDKLTERHKLTFIDNNYHNYDHARHREIVELYRPKYATTRDIMTKAQCRSDQIKFYELPQILEWGEELRAFSENVIIIPKYDCLDKIPDHFMLGYSIPSSHGGTPLPLEAFKGRRVHLLGGSWKDQLSCLAHLGDDVLSIDNNHTAKLAQFGQYIKPDGESADLGDLLHEYKINIPYYVCMALSAGAIGQKIHELYSNAS